MQIPQEYIENLIKDAKEIVKSADNADKVLEKIPPLIGKILAMDSLIDKNTSEL